MSYNQHILNICYGAVKVQLGIFFFFFLYFVLRYNVCTVIVK